MKQALLALGFLTLTLMTSAQSDQVSVIKNDEGMKLVVNGEDFMINGMNWDYFPIGTNYSYSLWKQSDDIIRAALDDEMGLLKNMGVNAIRVYTGVQPKWIEYIYENYGIYTMLNHSFGRYGLTIDDAWVAVTDYSRPKTQELLMSEVTQMVEDYKGTPGLLLFLLGNENNYGLFWAGAETEDFPDDDQEKAYIGETRGRPMYRLMNDAARAMKAIDPSHPVAICNGDMLFADIIAEECRDVDIYGVNMYRGVSFGDAFQRVRDELDMPIMFTEFGADAFHAIDNAEDQKMQAYYMVGNWKEIYLNAAGVGGAANSIGGFTFQFSDGWWKYGQTKNLDVHDNNASWGNGGYDMDYEPGENNMNEEWFGICAKGRTDGRGLYDLYPRAAYYALKEAHQIDPYAPGVTAQSIEAHFENISLMDAVLSARADKASLGGDEKLRLSQLRAEFSTFNTGGNLITTPKDADPDEEIYPDELGFDHMQSFYVGVEGNPAPNMRANVTVNILGNVATNPIDEIFYENRGRTATVNTVNGPQEITDLDRVRIYNAEFEWSAKDFDARGFYRTGHYHWGYEGDFFGLYPEANYGPNLDIYNGEILGMEIDGKRKLKGLKVAFGPQLWWGANPALLLKYTREFNHLKVTGIFHEDIDDASSIVSSIAIPMPKTRRATLHLERDFGALGVELGGIWGGSPLNGRTFQFAEGESGDYIIYEDKIQSSDNWGGKAKITYSKGRINWYAQGAMMGLVATGGGDYTTTFTGWRLKEPGGGNYSNFLTGFTYSLGNFQIAPNFMWQQPLVDPMPNDVTAPGRLRNIIDDPFAVRGNRETVAGELLLTFDPTPGTWMYEWDNDRAEDAKFAVSAGFVYRHLPTTQDAAIGFLRNREQFAFPQSAPAQDLWESNVRIVSKINPDLGLIANILVGNAQANGSDDRLIQRFVTDLRLIYKRMKVTTHVKVDDWGPFDYHRDFNLTYPLQFMLDVSTTLGKPDWFILPSTQMGIRATVRTLDQYSPRYSPNESTEFILDPIISPIGFDNGLEWEIRTYVHINIGK